MQMRIRGVEIDLVIVGMAVILTAVGLASGFGILAIVAGIALAAVAHGSRYVGAWVTGRFALPPRGAPEREHVIRSLAAAAAMKRLVQSAPSGPVTGRCREMERQARTALPTIRAPAPQKVRVRRLADESPLPQLESGRAHTARLLAAQPPGGMRSE